MPAENNHKMTLIETISAAIEKSGQDDPTYDNIQKSRDILDALESLLAYAIYNTCISPETIRDSSEESYINIKRRALAIWNNHESVKNIA